MPLQVYEIRIKVYAENQAEADALQAEFLAFVRDKREQGVPVKASRIIDALQRFKNNIFVHNFLNQ